MIYRVIPYEQSFDSYGLIYKIPEVYASQKLIGSIAEFPFWKKILRGCIVEQISESARENISYEIKEMKWLISEEAILSQREIEMIDFIAKQYFCQIHLALKLYISSQLLRDISKLKYFSRKEKSYHYTFRPLHLNTKQASILEQISSLPKWSVSLLYWVTGSGKTQIYIKMIEEALSTWQQALLLIPEIILTSQIGEKLKAYFWDDVILIHSHISPTKKIQYYKDIASWNAKIIIGTRSALFYPYHTLAYIIIDEEHDRSYISDTSPRYHAKTIAKKMCEVYGCSLLLASWTPELTSLYSWLSWEYHFFQMLESYTQ